MSKTSGVYAIKNKVNNKTYIGSSVCIEHRWSAHRADLKAGRNSIHLQHAWDKYGASNFSWGIIEEVSDITKLIEREQFHIDAISANMRYNISQIAGSRKLGVRHADHTVTLTYHGRTMPLLDWAKEIKIGCATLRTRRNLGWSAERIIETPVNAHQKYYTWHGKTQNHKDWAKDYDIEQMTLKHRLNKGMTLEEALLTPTGGVIMIHPDGRTKSIIEWAKELGIAASTLYNRHEKLGWSDEKSLLTPVGQEKGGWALMLTFEGKTQSINDWAKDKGINKKTLWQRIRELHWTIEKALNTPTNKKQCKWYSYNAKQNRYIACRQINGKNKYIGCFKTEQEAKIAVERIKYSNRKREKKK